MVTIELIKELRERTGAGIMDAKKALTEVDGDIEEAITWLRKKGMAAGSKKADRIAAEGMTSIAVDGNEAVIYEVNSETDFVAKNDNFKTLIANVGEALLASGVTTYEEALTIDVKGETLDEAINQATATIGERISFRRFERVTKTDDESFGTYIHMGGNISAVVVMNGGDAEVAENIAMQVASMNPRYITRDDIDDAEMTKERDIQVSITESDESLKDKPEQVLKGIIEGRVSKALKDFTLVEQDYFKESKQSVKQYLKESNASVVKMVRFQLGDGIEKKEEDFAAEVASQVK